MKNGIYPIYFIWETGLLQTIGQLLRGGQSRGVFDTAVDFWDGQVEKAARRLGGERIWSGMKRNAERASAPGGGAALVADLLKAFCTKHPGVELHAAGHSAGAIFHAHFLPEVFRKGVPAFESLQLMAPAVRVDTFRELLLPQIAKNIKNLAMFTMKTDFELADNCAGIYRKSLLYLIRKALEPEEEAELLGLEESLRRDGELVKLFGLEGNPRGNAEIIFSKSLADSGRSASRAVKHGDFDNDPPTMNSIALRVLGLPDNGVIEFFPKSKGRALGDPWAPPDLSDLFPFLPGVCRRFRRRDSFLPLRVDPVHAGSCGGNRWGGRRATGAVRGDQRLRHQASFRLCRGCEAVGVDPAGARLHHDPAARRGGDR